MSRFSAFIKIISIVLVITFLFQEVNYAAPMDSSGALNSPRPIEIISATPSLFEPPLDFVTMKEVHKGDNGTFIIHIQDAHSNLSGQQNLANALDAIMSKYHVSLILSEGGADDCSLTPIKKIAPPEVWKRIAKSYLIQGKISGEEYLNLVSDHPMKIIGLEDIALYLKSVQNYAELADKREEILEYLKKIRYALDKLKRKLYPSELVEYESKRHPRAGDDNLGNFKDLLELAATKNIDLSEFPEITKLIELELKEKLIDFNLANLEQAALVEEIEKKGGAEELKEHFKKVGQMKDAKASQFAYFQNTFRIAQSNGILLAKYPNLIAYGEYLKDFSELDLDQVLDELQKAEDKVYVALLSTQDASNATGGAIGGNKNSTGDAEGWVPVNARETLAFTGSPQRQDPSNLKTAGPVVVGGEGSHDALLIRSIDRYLGLLQTAYKIQMTTKEFNLFKTNEPDFGTVQFLAFVNRKLAEQGYFEDMIPYQPKADPPLTGKNLLEEGKKSLEAFYDSVAQRDVAFLANTEKALKNENQKVAVLISGGYHTPHLKKLFREKGYSMAVLTPIVTSETNQAKYEKLLLAPIKKEIKKVETVQGVSASNGKSLSALEEDFVRKKKNDGVRTLAERTEILVGHDPMGSRLALMIEETGVSKDEAQKIILSLRAPLPAFAGKQRGEAISAGARASSSINYNQLSLRINKAREILKRLFKLELREDSPTPDFIARASTESHEGFRYVNHGRMSIVFESSEYPNLIFKIRKADSQFFDYYREITNMLLIERLFSGNHRVSYNGWNLISVSHIAPFAYFNEITVERKADMDMSNASPGHLDQAIRALETSFSQAGVQWSDDHTRNVGYIDGELDVVDFGSLSLLPQGSKVLLQSIPEVDTLPMSKEEIHQTLLKLGIKMTFDTEISPFYVYPAVYYYFRVEKSMSESEAMDQVLLAMRYFEQKGARAAETRRKTNSLGGPEAMELGNTKAVLAPQHPSVPANGFFDSFHGARAAGDKRRPPHRSVRLQETGAKVHFQIKDSPLQAVSSSVRSGGGSVTILYTGEKDRPFEALIPDILKLISMNDPALNAPGKGATVNHILHVIIRENRLILSEARREMISSGNAMIVEYTLNPAGARAAEMTDSDIDDLWEEIQNGYVLYHGTSTKNLDSIKQHGLDPARKPFDSSDIDFFEEMHVKALGKESPLPYRHRSGIFYVTANRQNALEYSQNGPEVIALMLKQIPEIFSTGKLSEAESRKLRDIEQKYGEWMDGHQAVVLKIKGAVLQDSNISRFKTREAFIAEAKRVQEAYRAEGSQLTKSEFEDLVLLGVEAQVERVSPDMILAEEASGARAAKQTLPENKHVGYEVSWPEIGRRTFLQGVGLTGLYFLVKDAFRYLDHEEMVQSPYKIGEVTYFHLLDKTTFKKENIYENHAALFLLEKGASVETTPVADNQCVVAVFQTEKKDKSGTGVVVAHLFPGFSLGAPLRSPEDLRGVLNAQMKGVLRIFEDRGYKTEGINVTVFSVFRGRKFPHSFLPAVEAMLQKMRNDGQVASSHVWPSFEAPLTQFMFKTQGDTMMVRATSQTLGEPVIQDFILNKDGSIQETGARMAEAVVDDLGLPSTEKEREFIRRIGAPVSGLDEKRISAQEAAEWKWFRGNRMEIKDNDAIYAGIIVPYGNPRTAWLDGRLLPAHWNLFYENKEITDRMVRLVFGQPGIRLEPPEMMEPIETFNGLSKELKEAVLHDLYVLTARFLTAYNPLSGEFDEGALFEPGRKFLGIGIMGKEIAFRGQRIPNTIGELAQQPLRLDYNMIASGARPAPEENGIPPGFKGGARAAGGQIATWARSQELNDFLEQHGSVLSSWLIGKTEVTATVESPRRGLTEFTLRFPLKTPLRVITANMPGVIREFNRLLKINSLDYQQDGRAMLDGGSLLVRYSSRSAGARMAQDLARSLALPQRLDRHIRRSLTRWLEGRKELLIRAVRDGSFNEKETQRLWDQMRQKYRAENPRSMRQFFGKVWLPVVLAEPNKSWLSEGVQNALEKDLNSPARDYRRINRLFWLAPQPQVFERILHYGAVEKGGELEFDPDLIETVHRLRLGGRRTDVPVVRWMESFAHSEDLRVRKTAWLALVRFWFRKNTVDPEFDRSAPAKQYPDEIRAAIAYMRDYNPQWYLTRGNVTQSQLETVHYHARVWLEGRGEHPGARAAMKAATDLETRITEYKPLQLPKEIKWRPSSREELLWEFQYTQAPYKLDEIPDLFSQLPGWTSQDFDRAKSAYVHATDNLMHTEFYYADKKRDRQALLKYTQPVILIRKLIAEDGGIGLELVFQDTGPGIDDLGWSVVPRHTFSSHDEGGQGYGMSAIIDASNEVAIYSKGEVWYKAVDVPKGRELAAPQNNPNDYPGTTLIARIWPSPAESYAVETSQKRGAENEEKSALFSEAFGARLADREVPGPAEFYSDRESLVLLAMAYLKAPKLLKGILNFYFAALKAYANVEYVAGKEASGGGRVESLALRVYRKDALENKAAYTSVEIPADILAEARTRLGEQKAGLTAKIILPVKATRRFTSILSSDLQDSNVRVYRLAEQFMRSMASGRREELGYNRNVPVHFRFLSSRDLTKEETQFFENLVRAAQDLLEGVIDIEFGKYGQEEWRAVPEKDKVVYLGQLGEVLLQMADGHGISPTAEQETPDFHSPFLARIIFASLVQRLNGPTPELEQIWKAVRADVSSVLTKDLFDKMKKADKNLGAVYYRVALVKIIKIVWEEIMQGTREALDAVGAAA